MTVLDRNTLDEQRKKVIQEIAQKTFNVEQNIDIKVEKRDNRSAISKEVLEKICFFRDAVTANSAKVHIDNLTVEELQALREEKLKENSDVTEKVIRLGNTKSQLKELSVKVGEIHSKLENVSLALGIDIKRKVSSKRLEDKAKIISDKLDQKFAVQISQDKEVLDACLESFTKHQKEVKNAYIDCFDELNSKNRESMNLKKKIVEAMHQINAITTFRTPQQKAELYDFIEKDIKAFSEVYNYCKDLLNELNTQHSIATEQKEKVELKINEINKRISVLDENDGLID